MTAWQRFLVIAVFVLFATSVSYAGDFCFNSTSPPNPASPDNPDILVLAQNFRVPAKGKCKAIVGWDTGYFNGTFPRPASGTACLNSAGTRLHVGIMLHAVRVPSVTTDSEIHVHMNLPYPALQGGDVYIRQDLPFRSLLRNDGVAGPCGFNFPIP
jgi:hypothetical protein